MFDNIRQTKP